MMTDKDSSAAGTDNRPPMLEENDYESWRIRIKRYIKGKPHRKLIWKSIQNGPTPHPQTTDLAPEGGAVPPPGNKRNEEFTEEDNRNELADIQAINILSQGLPRHIFNILNQNETGREIWVNLELLTKDYFVGFHKLVNDMKVTQLEILTHQLNTKFANNLPSYWGKYVMHEKNNMNMSTVTYVELFTHLRTYKEHALKSLKKKGQSFAVVDPLAYLAKTTPTHSTTSPVTIPTPQSSGDSYNDAMLATMKQIAKLLSGLQKQFPPTNNQLRTSSNPKTRATMHDGQIVTKMVQRRAPGNTGTKGIQTIGSGVNKLGKKVIFYNCRGEGHVARQCKEPKHARDSQWYHDKALLMKAKEKGAVLDTKAEAFLADVECTTPYNQPLALTTTNLFEANHKDAYDSDVDEGPHASVAFMANLSSTCGINGSSSSHINEVQISDDSFFSDVSYSLAQEMQQEEHLNSEVDSVLDDNMITYDEYQNDSGVEAVPTVVSADEAAKQSMIAILQRMHTEMTGYVRVNDEHKLVNATLTAKLELCKIKMQALKRNKVKHDLDMAIVERNKRNAKLEEENVMLKSTLKSKVVSIENLQQESKHVLSKKKTLRINLGYSNPRYGKQARIAQPVLFYGHVLLNPNHPPTRVHDSKESLVHAKGCKIKMAERPRHALPINYAKLKALCYEELSKANTHLRTTSLEKIAAQKAEIATLNAKTVGNKTSGTTKPVNPKVIAPEMYAISPKYIVPQRRTNRETSIPFPKKKQVTFQETPKPSPRFTKKPVAPLLKKPNINVPLSTGIKSATGASKPASKSNAWIYRKLPAKKEHLPRDGKPVKEVLRINLSVHRCSVHTVIIDPNGIRGPTVIVIESFIRRDLQLQDAKGTACLPNDTIFKELARMGTMASAIIYLAKNQKFNFSMYIFDNMVFANMKIEGNCFSGIITTLFETMMVQAPKEVGEGSEVLETNTQETDKNQAKNDKTKHKVKKIRKDKVIRSRK
nr:hypothetical protein [Tanacetum cinerariifolium]